MDIFYSKFHPHRARKYVNYGQKYITSLSTVWISLMKFALASHRFEKNFCTMLYDNLKKFAVALTGSQTDRREGNVIASSNKYRQSSWNVNIISRPIFQVTVTILDIHTELDYHGLRI